ncbi:MAG: 50S ribosomal protein L6 [Desulfarculus sp.]|nr:50S ribosomal protein L6 [Desulfarculus sp.]
MSRIGKLPIALPSGVEVSITEQEVVVKGPKGTLRRQFHPMVQIEREENTLRVKPQDQSQQARALWGLSRSLLNNMVVGVSAGFTKVLEIIGVGYKAEMEGNNLKLALGFSHPVIFPLPEGISGSVEKNTIVTLTGFDKELLGQVCANLRRYRPPEPYKGKGIKFQGEVIRRKVGKAGVK